MEEAEGVDIDEAGLATAFKSELKMFDCCGWFLASRLFLVLLEVSWRRSAAAADGLLLLLFFWSSSLEKSMDEAAKLDSSCCLSGQNHGCSRHPCRSSFSMGSQANQHCFKPSWPF